MARSIVLITAVSLFVILAGLFAGAETGLYQLSRLRLRLSVEKKRWPFVILGKCIHDSPGLLLSMLIGTNLAQYLTTSIVTSMFLSKYTNEHTAEGFATLLTVPILFIFSELIPKNLFFYRADALMPLLSPILYVIHKILSWSGVVPLLKIISSFLARLTGLVESSSTVITSTYRRKVQAILKDTHDEGILSPVQSDIIKRLVSISHVHIGSVMIPMNHVEMIRFDSDRSALLNKLNKYTFTRLLVTGSERGNILGFVNIYETLGSLEEFTDLKRFIKPIREIDAGTTVTDAINLMQTEKERILLVIRASRIGRARPIGIVTMKDLVEELLGELAEW